MSTRTRWSVGLQWGACAWLVYVAARALAAALAQRLGAAHLPFLPTFWPSTFAWLMAPVWMATLVSVLSGARWSRGAVAAAVCTQLVVGATEAAAYGGPLDLLFVLRFFGPMSLPLLPLVVLPATEPRLVLASLAGGRWRDAIGRMGGWRTGLVAALLISLNRGAYGLIVRLYQGAGIEALTALLIPALLVAFAALALRDRPQQRRIAATS